MAVRTLERGYPTSVRTYATEDRAQKEAVKWADKATGLCNVMVVPVTDQIISGRVRYTAVFSCFSEEGDIFLLARAGCPFMVFR